MFSKRKMRIFSTLFLLLFIFSIPVPVSARALTAEPFRGCVSLPTTPAIECEALVALHSSTNGDGWINNTGWLKVSAPCKWYGVTCNSEGHVVSLMLGSNKLSGTLAPELGNLTSLTQLWLYSNELEGPIPAQLGNLKNLTFLYLSYNKLTGPIPVRLRNLSQLDRLHLESNQLTGSIPGELGNLVKLTELDLSNNQLSGPTPAQLGKLTQLRFLHLSFNKLSGSIPPQLGKMTSLETMNFFSNELTGPIPVELSNLSNLISLRVLFNHLSGRIPPELGNLTNLTDLALGNNDLTGQIPPQLANLTKLTQLFLNQNHLTGSFPTELGNLTNLKLLWLHGNLLAGSMPAELGNLTNLEQLSLSGNLLFGEIPSSITNLTHLTSLDMDCTLESSDQNVITFVTPIAPGWLNKTCPLTTVNLESVAAQDGWVLESAENSNTGGTLDSTSTFFRMGDNAANKQYRAILSFDASSVLPDNVRIFSAMLKIKQDGLAVGSNPFATLGNIRAIGRYGYFGTPILELADFSSSFPERATTSFTRTSDGWYVMTLDYTDRAAINALTATQFRLSFQIDDNQNNTADFLKFFSSDVADPANRPQLVIQYFTP